MSARAMAVLLAVAAVANFALALGNDGSVAVVEAVMGVLCLCVAAFAELVHRKVRQG